MKMYPRTAIDNAKSVRQNAHTVHGLMAASAGRRMAKHMPKTVAAWLSGLYDSDRSVVEATQSSLRHVFTTPEKIQGIRKAYQQPILAYCRDAIDNETAATLSDERTVSADDAEAKYSRVVSACIALLGSLLANLQPDELAKHQADYDSLLGDKKLWEFAAHNDASIRRSLHRFLKTCLAKQPDAIAANLDTITQAQLATALNSDQTSSIYDYVDALTLLTLAYPAVWTDHYKSKTPVDRRLRQFLKKGSQLGPRDFWVRLAQLFKAIPSQALPDNAADAAQLLAALHGGIVRKDEPKSNHEAAFQAYLDIVALVSNRLSEEEERSKLLVEMVLPIITQYLRPTVDTSQWTLPSNAAGGVLSKAIAMPTMAAILQEKWPQFTTQLIDDIKTSAPEQSKDYQTSQTSVLQHATRFANLQEQVIKVDASSEPVYSQASSSVVSGALEVVKNRNGKPYGAAGAIAALLHRNKSLVSASQSEQQLERFVQDDLPALILSPSSTYLVDILYSFSDSPFFKSAWSAALKAVLKETDSPVKTKALEAILTSPRIPSSFDLATSDPELQNYVKSSVQEAVQGSLEWDSFNRILQSQANILSTETIDEILTYMTQSLSISQHASYSLQGLRQIVKSNPSMLREFLAAPQGSKLLQALLLASESPNDEISQSASAVNASIQTILSAGSDTKQSIFDLIQQGLQEANKTSVSVETLVDLAKQSVKPETSYDEVARIFPSIDDWNTALAPFLNAAPKPSLAITNPLGSGVYLVKPQQSSSEIRNLPRDSDGYSAAYRITQYVTRLFKHLGSFAVQNVPRDVQDAYLHNIALTVQLADDNLGLAGANGLWAEYNPDVEADAMTFTADAQSFIVQELKRLEAKWSEGQDDSSLLMWAVELLAKVETDTSPKAYYTARAYSVVIANAVDICGFKNSQNAQLQEISKSMFKNKGTSIHSLEDINHGGAFQDAGITLGFDAQPEDCNSIATPRMVRCLEYL